MGHRLWFVLHDLRHAEFDRPWTYTKRVPVQWDWGDVECDGFVGKACE